MSQSSNDTFAPPTTPTIEDVCWELFGGPCGVHATQDAMATCPRKIRDCDVFVPTFRKATALLREASRPAPPPSSPPAPPSSPPAPPVEGGGPAQG